MWAVGFRGQYVPCNLVTRFQSFPCGGGGEPSLLLLVSLVETGEKPFQPVQFAVALSIYLARQLGVSAFSEPGVGKDASVVTQLPWKRKKG